VIANGALAYRVCAHMGDARRVGRLRLANAVLSARHGVSDAATIKAVALRRMAMWRHEYRLAL